MSNLTTTVLWTGKFVKLVKHSGYSSYQYGSQNYTSGYVAIEPISSQDGYAREIHSTATSLAPKEQEAVLAKGKSWGRLNPAVIDTLIAKAQAADAKVPAEREAKKAQAAKDEAREAEVKALHKAAWDARVHNAQQALALIESIRAEAVPSQGLALAGLALDLLDYRACGGTCGRRLPVGLFGAQCGQAGCGQPICQDCRSDTTDADGFRLCYPESVLVCSKHSEQIRERLLAAKVAKSQKKTG